VRRQPGLGRWLGWASAALAVSLLLAVLDARGNLLRAWVAYGVVALLSAVLLLLAWERLGREAPRAILVAMLVALALRLAVGVTLMRVLPVAGYPTDPQRAGYVYWDSYKRDTDAWNISRMPDPIAGLLAARAVSDQYMGMAAFSAGVYALLSPDAHRPLLMIEFTALASAFSVLFTWAFGRALLGEGVGRLAAWGVALYPEAVLLGSSQMREPFLIACFAAGLYGFARERQGGRRSGIAWMAAAVMVALPLSPPFALTLVAVLAGAWLWEGGWSTRRWRLVLIGAALLALAALVLMSLAWSSIAGPGAEGAGVLLSWWALVTDTWRMNLLIETSPIIGFFLEMFPGWAQMPAITAYGLLLPLLPAALADAGNPVWWTIAVYRALGWTVLIPFLLAGALLVHRTRSWKSIQGYLVIIIAVSAVAAATRASSLQWDNPRYRAVLLAAQIVLAAWVWLESRRRGDPWLRRIVWIEAADLALILVWYAGRYWGLPQIGLARTLIGMAIVTLGMLTGFLVSDRHRQD